MNQTACDALSHHFLTMAYNNAWANFRLAKACLQLTQEEYDAKRSSFFPCIRATLNHILMVDWVYVDGMEREAKGELPHPNYREMFADPDPCKTAAAWRAEQEKVDQRLIAYCQGLRDADMGRIVAYLRPDGSVREPRNRLLAHVFQHQIHHRGQVHAMLSGTSVAPPQLDDFFRVTDIKEREADFAELGWTEAGIWGQAHG
ncbi:MAG TPA: DinB family protein [Burkholderiaceae bacterium]